MGACRPERRDRADWWAGAEKPAAAPEQSVPYLRPRQSPTLDRSVPYLRRAIVDVRAVTAELLENVGDCQAVGRLAHRLKRTAGSFGFVMIASRAAAIEAAAKSGGDFKGSLPGLEEALDVTAQALGARSGKLA
jgi:HPt (histidine-containing phosphotransfer) domain-containing protein